MARSVDTSEEQTVAYRAAQVRFCPAAQTEELQDQLRGLAGEIAAGLSLLDPAQGKQLLGEFVSELMFSMAEQERREQHRQRQAGAIAAAKVRGVRFGRPYVECPEDFPAIVAEWEQGQITLQEALARSHLARATFYRRVREFRLAEEA